MKIISLDAVLCLNSAIQIFNFALFSTSKIFYEHNNVRFVMISDYKPCLFYICMHLSNLYVLHLLAAIYILFTLAITQILNLKLTLKKKKVSFA